MRQTSCEDINYNKAVDKAVNNWTIPIVGVVMIAVSLAVLGLSVVMIVRSI
jgi:hypothetical protein